MKQKASIPLACIHTPGKHTPTSDERCAACKAGPFGPMRQYAQEIFAQRNRDAVAVRQASRQTSKLIRQYKAWMRQHLAETSS